MGGFGTSFKEKEKNVINEIKTQPQQQNQGIGAFDFEMVEEFEGHENKNEKVEKKVEKKAEKKVEGDFGDFEVVEEEEKEFVPKEPYQVYNNMDEVDLEVQAYMDEQRAKAQLAYEEKVVDMKDAAKMSDKKTVFGKAYSEKTRKKNAAIDRSKMLTDKATSLTYSAHEHINKVNQQYDLKRLEKEQEEKLSKELKKELNDEQKQQAKVQARENLKAKALQHLMELKEFPLDEKCFERAMLINNFDRYYSLIKDFELLNAQKDTMAQVFQDTLAELNPFITLLKTRLTVFVEQNRVRLDGTILGEKDKPAVMRQKDLDAWRNLFHPDGDYQIKDEDRLKKRVKKEEKGLSQALPYGSYAKITREEAMNTASDLKSQKKRDQLRDLNLKLYDLGQKELAKTINEYVVGNRYAVGYTEERDRLMKAMKAVDKALKKQQDAEVAEALKNIQNYFKEMTNGTLELPENAADIPIHEDSQMKNEGINDGMVRNAFVTGTSYWSDQKDTPLFAHEPVINDLKQRMVSNCFMMAATAGVVNVDPAIIKSCLKDMGDGTVVVRLYDVINANEGEQPKPIYIRVRKTIPRIWPSSADTLSAGTLWMQMIEKAFAFYGRQIGGSHVKGYRSLWYGNGAKYLENLLGIKYSFKQFQSYRDVKKDREQKEELFNELQNIETDKKVYSTGSRGRGQGDGIQSGHAYTILGATEINGVKYVKMRNPYSNHSLHYDEKGKRSQTGSSVITFANSSDETYGQFLIKLDDFCTEFESLYITDLSQLEQQNQNQNQN